MKVKMLRTIQGSPDGIQVHTYREGQVYSPETEPPMSATLRSILLRGRLAQDTDEAKVAPDDRETKVVNPVDEQAGSGAESDVTESDEGQPTQVEVGDLTVSEALDAVRDGEISAQEALAQERNGKGRSTLIGQLLEILREG